MKLYKVICWYNDTVFGWVNYCALSNTSYQKALEFIQSKEDSDDIYKIVEVENETT